MNKSRKLTLLGLVVILAIPLLEYSTNHTNSHNFNPTMRPDLPLNLLTTKQVTNITLILNYNSGTNLVFYNISLIGDITPFNATITAIGLENISYYTAANGVFVKGLHINGSWYVNNPSGQNWLYYVNGQLAGVSCSVLELQDNWVVEWVFKSGNPFSEDPALKSDFWLYFSIFAGICTICIIVIVLVVKNGI
ncbi:MAG: DUF4430 domain-containing protein [Candidatus Helarchaeota archaeon]